MRSRQLALATLCLTTVTSRTQAQSPTTVAPAERPRPRVVLALSGGGARGIAHIGALRALEEAGIPVDAIAANSMGAVVGGIYATGRYLRRAGAGRPVPGLGLPLQREAGPADTARRPAAGSLRVGRRGELRLEEDSACPVASSPSTASTAS